MSKQEIVILTNNGNVLGVYVPQGGPGKYIVIDRDDEAEEVLHSTGQQLTSSHDDLQDYDHQAFNLVFGEDADG